MVSRTLTQVEERASAVHVAIADKWQQAQVRDGYTLTVERQPVLFSNKRGESVGIEFYVRLTDPQGKQAHIDPHRRIINPPTQVVVSDAEFNRNGIETKARVLRHDPEAAIWEVLWQSVMGVPR